MVKPKRVRQSKRRLPQKPVSRKLVQQFIGKEMFAVRKDGSIVTGRLLGLSGNRLVMAPLSKDKGKKVKTKFFFFPLLLGNVIIVGALGFLGGYLIGRDRNNYPAGGVYCRCGRPGCGGCY